MEVTALGDDVTRTRDVNHCSSVHRTSVCVSMYTLMYVILSLAPLIPIRSSAKRLPKSITPMSFRLFPRIVQSLFSSIQRTRKVCASFDAPLFYRFCLVKHADQHDKSTCRILQMLRLYTLPMSRGNRCSAFSEI